MSLPDPFALALALFPVIVYLLVIGGVRFSGRAIVTTASRECVGLALAVSGMIAVGPAQLFFPSAAATLLGPWVWVLLGTFYLLCVMLMALNVRPRLVVIGRTAAEVYPHVVAAAGTIDRRVTPVPDKQQLHLVDADVRLRLDGLPGIDHVQIVAFEPQLPVAFWMLLRRRLREELPPLPVASGGRGGGMLLCGLALLGFTLTRWAAQPDLVMLGLKRFLFHQ